ncbi:MAG: lysine--tRNA ligase, partial [Pseudomonadota bacterium]|nr:lysine--tRNA ligase [Pseudomonadota bacterium]
KDLMDSVRLSSRICKILGARPPEGFTYELFLDENGEKISKSRGNGLTVEEWLRYAPNESLQLYMYNSPKKAKRLYFDVIPKHVDDYLGFLGKLDDENDAQKLENPVWHIHRGNAPRRESQLSFSLLLNLASACNTEDPDVLWGFISRYDDGVSPENSPILDRLSNYAITYYKDFVKPEKRYRAPTDAERDALEDLVESLLGLPIGADAAAIQREVFSVGKENDYENLRDWFKSLYEILLGREQGPRIGSFIALYGIAETVDLIKQVLDGQDISGS